MTGRELIELIKEKNLLDMYVETSQTPVICFDTTITPKNYWTTTLVLTNLYNSNSRIYKPGDIIGLKPTSYNSDE